MAKKIITWITSNNCRWNWNGDNFLFEVQPFDYEGKEIRMIEVSGGSTSHYSGHVPSQGQSNDYNSRARVEINLQKSEIETVREGKFLVIKGNVDIKKWKGPSELRFKLSKKNKVGHGSGSFENYRVDLETEVNNNWGGGDYLIPKIRGFQVSFKEEDERDELYNRLRENEEYTISNIDWDCVALLESTSPKILGLNYNGKYHKPTIESAKEKQDSAEQRARKKAAKDKVWKVTNRAMQAKDRLFVSGFDNKSKEDFQEAVRALSELIKIAKNGNKEEKEEYKTYVHWQEGVSFFKELKETIQMTSEKNGQGWKYDLGKPEEINWGSTSQPEINGSPNTNDSDTSDNGKKRKNDGNDNDNDSRESKRVKVEEEVKQDQTKRNEEVSAKITEALQGLSENATDQEKENKLAEIEKSKNEGKISEEQEAKITEKKDELANKNPQGYGRMMAEVLERKIAEFKLQIDKLGQVITDKLNKLKNGEFTSDTEVRQAEEEISEVVSEEVAVVETDNLLTQAQKVLNATAGDLKKQLEKIKKDLWSLKLSTNPYQQKAYQTKKDKVEKALRDLENFSQNNTQQPGFFRPEVIVPVSLLVVLVVAAIVIVRRRKQAKVK